MNKNQKGYSTLESLLLLVIVVLVGLVGWYVWHNKASNGSTTNMTVTTTPQAKTANQQALTQSSASKTVTDFYGKYIKLNLTEPTQESFLRQYGTVNLLTYFKNNQNGVDPIVCAQDRPDSFKVTSSIIVQKTATVDLEETFGIEKVRIIVAVVDQNGLKIDALKCPTPLPAAKG